MYSTTIALIVTIVGVTVGMTNMREIRKPSIPKLKSQVNGVAPEVKKIVSSKNMAFSIGFKQGSNLAIMSLQTESKFNIVNSLYNANTISFELTERPGYFLCRVELGIVLEKLSHAALSRCSFYERDALDGSDGSSFESVDRHGYFISSLYNVLSLLPIGGGDPKEINGSFKFAN